MPTANRNLRETPSDQFHLNGAAAVPGKERLAGFMIGMDFVRITVTKSIPILLE